MGRIEHFFRLMRKAMEGVGLHNMVALARPTYYRLLILLYPHGVPRYLYNEPVLFFSATGRGVTEELEPNGFTRIKNCVHEGALVLDIGANLGMYSLMIARWVGGTGKVFAFEPVPATAAKLRKHVELNALAAQVEVIQAAVGDVEGEVLFSAFEDDRHGHSSVASAASAGCPTLTVPVTTVDRFCQSRGLRPSFLKIDVEGYESHVLDGAKRTINCHKPTLLIETHPQFWPQFNVTAEQFASQLEALRHLGYEIEKLGEAADPLTTRAHLLCRTATQS
jgi:FkbM family methyltransferase